MNLKTEVRLQTVGMTGIIVGMVVLVLWVARVI